MRPQRDLPQRKHLRLNNFDYNSPGAYFVTICTHNKEKCLWNGDIDPQTFGWRNVGANCVRPQSLPLSDIGKIVIEELERWDNTYNCVSLHSYVIMPNHLHIMISIMAGEDGWPQAAPTVDRMVKQFKGSVTKKVGKGIWQKSFAEHVIRDRNDFEIRANYIYENPLRWHYDELYSE